MRRMVAMVGLCVGVGAMAVPAAAAPTVPPADPDATGECVFSEALVKDGRPQAPGSLESFPFLGCPQPFGIGEVAG